MSHLKHINEYKQSLIKLGITNPEDQIVLTRAAYVCAFIRLFEQQQIPEIDHKDVVLYISNYWNEKFPINGNIVLSLVRGFYARLYESLTNVKGNVFIDISTEQAVKDNPSFNDPETFDTLVQCLLEEATHKYKEAKGVQ